MMECFCHGCGNRFEEGELLRFEAVRVCAACKPEFLQRLREGEAVGAPCVCSAPRYVRVWGGHEICVEAEYNARGLWMWATSRLFIDGRLAGSSCRPGLWKSVTATMDVGGKEVGVELQTRLVRQINYVGFELRVAGILVDRGILKATHRFGWTRGRRQATPGD